MELRWIALATIFLVLIGVTGENAGGEIAHLGGISVGALYGVLRRRGKDILAPVESVPRRLKSLLKRERKDPHAAAPHTGKAPAGLSPLEQEELDTILDKIKKSGYTSLTLAERDRLFSVSSRIK